PFRAARGRCCAPPFATSCGSRTAPRTPPSPASPFGSGRSPARRAPPRCTATRTRRGSSPMPRRRGRGTSSPSSSPRAGPEVRRRHRSPATSTRSSLTTGEGSAVGDVRSGDVLRLVVALTAEVVGRDPLPRLPGVEVGPEPPVVELAVGADPRAPLPAVDVVGAGVQRAGLRPTRGVVARGIGEGRHVDGLVTGRRGRRVPTLTAAVGRRPRQRVVRVHGDRALALEDGTRDVVVLRVVETGRVELLVVQV